MWIVKKKIENKQKLFKQKYKAKARTDSNTNNVYLMPSERETDHRAVWPVYSRQMSIKVAQKWFH